MDQSRPNLIRLNPELHARLRKLGQVREYKSSLRSFSFALSFFFFPSQLNVYGNKTPTTVLPTEKKTQLGALTARSHVRSGLG